MIPPIFIPISSGGGNVTNLQMVALWLGLNLFVGLSYLVGKICKWKGIDKGEDFDFLSKTFFTIVNTIAIMMLLFMFCLWLLGG